MSRVAVELAAYVSMDRRHALAARRALPEGQYGAALFADISGFTPLAEALLRELGPQRGAEELNRYLNLVYDAAINEIHRFGGSVVAFAGDAITCWFDQRLSEGDGATAVLSASAAALAIQGAMQQFASLTTPSGKTFALALKAAIATGPVRRFAVGDPAIRLLEAMAGETLDRLASAEHHAAKGEVIVDERTQQMLADQADLTLGAYDQELGEQFWRLERLTCSVTPRSWPLLAPAAVDSKLLRPWLMPPVYERLRRGSSEFLAELRPTVALFVRFGGIDYDHDPHAGAKLDSYLRWLQGIVQRFAGTLIEVNFGDKGSYIYINFGAPIAHEDNAERAAAAALALRNLPPSLGFAGDVQIGISQGRMFAGAYGGTAHRTYGVIGDEVNMAARLMMAAQGGQTLVSESVYHRLATRFRFDALPPLRVKGKSEPANVYALTGDERTGRGLEPTTHAAILPLIGRDGEMKVAVARLEEAAQGHGQVLSIRGKAGLGKSRLASEIARAASSRGFDVLRGQCPSYGSNSSYLVWQDIWRDLFGLDTAMGSDEQIESVAQTLAGIDAGLAPRLPLLAPVLHIEIEDNDLSRSLDAKLRKAALEALLVDCFTAFARQRPLLVLLEDCQWIDPLSDDLLQVIASAVTNLPVMILYVHRPIEGVQRRLHWLAKYPRHTLIALEPLQSEAAGAFISAKARQLAGPQAQLSEALVQRITDRAEGNPFLLEELLLYLHNQNVDLGDGAAAAFVALPDSLQRLVLSTVDRLPESQKIAVKVASVIGRVFQAPWLWGVYPQLGSSSRVRRDLDALRDQELLIVDPGEAEMAFVFRQMITRDVIYESLPLTLKLGLHEQVGAYIEHAYAQQIDQQLDLLAYHYDRSDNTQKRRTYLFRAGEAAQAIYANDAAIDYYRRVLPLADEAQQHEILMRLGQTLELVGQWDEAATCYEQALAISETQDTTAAQAQSQVAIGEIHRKQGRFGEAMGWFDKAFAAAEAAGDQGGMAKALICSGTLAAQQGDYTTATMRYEQSLAIRRALQDLPNTANVLNNLAIVAQFQGDYELSRRFHEEALGIRRNLGGQWAIAISLNNLGTTALDQGDYTTARGYLEEALVVQRTIGDKWAIANALNNLANVQRELGNYSLAHGLYVESIALNDALGEQRALAYLLEDAGVLAALQNEPARAHMLVGAAFTVRTAISSPLSPAEQETLNARLQAASASLGESRTAAAFEQGKALSLAEALALAKGV